MRFATRPTRHPSPPPNYFSRREQLRILALVMMLGLVLLAMKHAARPATWSWLFGNASPPQSDEDRLIDTRRGVQPSLPAGVVEISPQVASSAPAATDLFPGMEAAWLTAIRDDTVFRAAETPAWYGMLAAVRDAPAAALAEATADTVSFTQLYQQPDAYRGRLVRLEGTVRRCHYIQARENDEQIPGYYRCWLWPNGSTHPVVLYCLGIPDRFPQGMSISEWVSVEGLFYKRWAYRAVDDIRVAPLVIAKVVHWTPAGRAP